MHPHNPAVSVLRFQYDRDLIAALNALDGAEYDLSIARWTVPTEHLQTLIDTFGDSCFRAEPGVQLPRAYKYDSIVPGFAPIRPTYSAQRLLSDRDFQAVGSSFIIEHPYCILADEQGLGKTKQVLDAVSHVQRERGLVLVLLKTSNIGSWSNEIAAFTIGQCEVADGSPTERLALYEYLRQSRNFTTLTFLLVSYNIFVRDVESLAALEFDWIIADEAHKLKSNPLNGQSLIAERIHRLWAPRITCLTGTPLVNNVSDAWNLLHWMELDKRSWDEFVADTLEIECKQRGRVFLNRIARTKPDGVRKVRELLRQYMLRRTKEEVAPELPEKTRIEIEIKLNMDECRRYDAAVEELLLYANEQDIEPEEIPNDDVLKLRLRQITSGDSKIAWVIETVEELAETAKVCVFSTFLETVQAVRAHLTHLNPAIVTGSTTHRQREIDKFQNDESCRVFLGTAQACREGLTLTAASYMVIVDGDWSPAYEDQLEDRIHRIGQRNPVTIYRLVATANGQPTIDTGVVRTVAAKRREIRKVI